MLSPCAGIALHCRYAEALHHDLAGVSADAHPLALQLRNLQSLVEIGVDKNTTVVFPAPLMTTISELGAFIAREQVAATPMLPPVGDGKLARVAANGTTEAN
jgi:hypothetical protein